MAHLVAHASGGCREADNLVLLCWIHHTMFDGGQLRMEGTATSPRFFDAQGRELGARIEQAAPVVTGSGAGGPAPEDPPGELLRRLCSEVPARAGADPPMGTVRSLDPPLLPANASWQRGRPDALSDFEESRDFDAPSDLDAPVPSSWGAPIEEPAEPGPP